jgi:hypothetical protein
MKAHFILMADVVKSGETSQTATAEALSYITTAINKAYKSSIDSPLTITLGDEFQGIVNSVQTGIAIMIAIEELCIQKTILFKLRYVFIKGVIETPINDKIAYGMLGAGLTEARSLLNMNKKKQVRFLVKCGLHDSELNKLLLLYQSLIADWSVKDYPLITDFIKWDDYKVVAKKNSKTPSLMWKRKKTFKIEEYNIIKSLLLDYVS